MKVRAGDQGHANQQHIDDGKRDQEMPPQAHQLVKAVPRYRESQPHEKIDVKAHFENEPEAAVNSGVERLDCLSVRGLEYWYDDWNEKNPSDSTTEKTNHHPD